MQDYMLKHSLSLFRLAELVTWLRFDPGFGDKIINSSQACFDEMKSVKKENLSIHLRQTLWEQFLQISYLQKGMN